MRCRDHHGSKGPKATIQRSGWMDAPMLFPTRFMNNPVLIQYVFLDSAHILGAWWPSKIAARRNADRFLFQLSASTSVFDISRYPQQSMNILVIDEQANIQPQSRPLPLLKIDRQTSSGEHDQPLDLHPSPQRKRLSTTDWKSTASSHHPTAPPPLPSTPSSPDSPSSLTAA